MLQTVYSSIREQVTIVSRDPGAGDDGTWQSGRIRLADGSVRRFIARGAPFLPVGSEVKVRGHWAPAPASVAQWTGDHEQFELDECTQITLPTTAAGVEAFIAGNVQGIHESRARQIVRRLGASAISLIKDRPELLAEIFPGKVGRDLVFAWMQWQERWREHEAAYDLALRFTSRGIAYRHVRRIMSFFRSADVAEVVVLRRPYWLLQVPGFGWEKADKVARQLGVPANHPERLTAAVVTALTDAAAEDGHSCLPRKELARRAAKYAGSVALGTQGVLAATEAGAVANDEGSCYLPAALEAEWTVGRHVRRRAGMTHVIPQEMHARVACRIADGRLSLDQAWAVWQALTCGVFVLTGGAGTGKTTTVRTIVACAEDMGLRLKVVAPTGKAASRAKKVTGAPAETVHRLLGGPPGQPRRAPLDLDMVIVDETSMASIEVVAWLLASLPPSARVVIVGDSNQLPSVDHGAVLRDLLAATSLPSLCLSEVHRQGRESGIVRNAYHLLRGAMLEPTADFRVVSVARRLDGSVVATDASQKEAVRQALTSELLGLRAVGVDLNADVQVLTPMKKKTHLLGVHSLNHLLQDVLNRDGQVGPLIGGGRRARIGDRLMQVRNDYGLGESGVFNGEVGRVVALGPESVTLRIDDERQAVVTGYRLFNLHLAWATTVHRSQGSEWPVVVVLAHRSHGRLLTPELLYTAVTRARREVVLITDEEALARIADPSNRTISARHTGLLRHLNI